MYDSLRLNPFNGAAALREHASNYAGSELCDDFVRV